MALGTLPFDGADALDTPEEQAAFLAEAFASRDPAVVKSALGINELAGGIAQVSRDTGLSREVL